MPWRSVLCHAVQCHAMSCEMPCHTIPCYATLCCAILHCAMPCYAMPCRAMLGRVAAENQTTRSQAALRQQYEERQRESEHVYELLENKIQLLQEVSPGVVGSRGGAGSRCLGAHPAAMQEARLARSEAEQATALAKAEAERCRELAGKLKEAARTKEEDRSDDGCGTMAQRWVPRTCPLYAASLCPVLILGDYQGAGAVQGREAAGIQAGGGVTPRRESWAVGKGEHP